MADEKFFVDDHGAVLSQAQKLSMDHLGRVVRVYRFPWGTHGIRLDHYPVSAVDGVDLVHVAAYLRGAKIHG